MLLAADDEDVVKTEWDQHTPGVTSPHHNHKDSQTFLLDDERERERWWIIECQENEDEEKIPKLVRKSK